MAKIKVGVAGYGTIGQRLADGVAMQGDMELVGIADLAPTLSLQALRERDMIGANGVKYNLYLVDGADEAAFAAKDIPVEGTFADLCQKVDILCPFKDIPVPEPAEILADNGARVVGRFFRLYFFYYGGCCRCCCDRSGRRRFLLTTACHDRHDSCKCDRTNKSFLFHNISSIFDVTANSGIPSGLVYRSTYDICFCCAVSTRCVSNPRLRA